MTGNCTLKIFRYSFSYAETYNKSSITFSCQSDRGKHHRIYNFLQKSALVPTKLAQVHSYCISNIFGATPQLSTVGQCQWKTLHPQTGE